MSLRFLWNNQLNFRPFAVEMESKMIFCQHEAIPEFINQIVNNNSIVSFHFFVSMKVKESLSSEPKSKNTKHPIVAETKCVGVL